MDSFYNPVKEAESIILQLEKSYNFFIITGLGSGILLRNLLQSFPESKIIVIENSQADYDYLKQLPLINTLYNNKNVIFSTIRSIKEDLQNNTKNAELIKSMIMEIKDNTNLDINLGNI